MSGSHEEKQYGLILPKKQQAIPRKVSNVFGDDNDTDEEDGTDWVKKALQAEGEKNKVKKQTKLNMQKALKEDPTIFQYDEVYDDMERTKEQSKPTTNEKKKPRYIQNLLKAAERRKKEHEYRIERMVQKERESEGAMYADKESFVTSAYRAKLEEFKKMEEEENKMDRLEAIADVKKQQDMSGFYRHLYEQTVDPSSQEHDVENDTNENKTNLSSSDNVSKDIVAEKEQLKNKEMKRNRQYRQRKVEEDSDTDETETQETVEIQAKTVTHEKPKDTEHEAVQSEPEIKKQRQQDEDTKIEETQEKIIEGDKAEDTVNSQNTKEVSENCESNEKAEMARISAKEKIEAEKKERSKIWVKRTVGAAFEAALQRYYARKASRLAAA